MGKDVELIIRAKDAATSAIKSITDSLKELSGIQDDVGQSAIKTDTLLGKLGNELKSLTQEARGISALGKIATEIDKAGTALKSIETNVRSSAAELAKMAREAETAGQHLNSLRGTLEAEKRTLKETVDSRRAAKEELKQVDSLVRKAESNQEKYAKAIKDTPAVKLSSAQRSAETFLTADITNAKARQAALNQEIAKFDTVIEGSREAIKTLKPEIAAATTQQGKLTKELERTSGSLRREREDLTKARGELSQIQGIATQASTALGGMAVNQDKVADASARLAAELARTKTRIDSLGAIKLPQGNEEWSPRRQLLESKKVWVEAEAEVKRLAQAYRQAKAPTEEMGAALGRAQAVARTAKSTYEQQATALHRLSGIAQSSFSAFDQQASAMQRAGTAARVLGSYGNTAANAIRPIAPAATAAGSAMQGATGGANAFRGALAGVYGESRKSLSLMQRMRGEILALTASYVGLQAGLQQIGGVIAAFQTIEAAQSRLGAVFDQDTTKIRRELDFLERQAQRLGISFDVLSNQYSKFAIAADAANFSAAATRKIFLSVAEAGRVNKLSLDQLSGVFLAIEQIISKGKFTSEEVRRQLGDRLPGAFNILADAIGVTTAELDEMMRKGELLATQENLLKFAEQLNSRFGPQLAASLRTTTTEIGRFRDNIFQAQLQVASGGFIESLNVALAELNEWFRSREGRDFFLTLGAALGKFVAVLAGVPDYFQEIQVAIAAFVGFKLAGVFTGLVTSLRQTQGGLGNAARSFFTWNGTVQAAQARVVAFRGALTPTTGVLAAFRAQLLGATAAAGIAGARFVALQSSLAVLRGTVVAVTGAARLMWAVLGGIPGIIFTAVTFAFGAWLTKVEDTTRAIDEHKRIMGEVISAYERVTDKTRDWANEIKNVTLDQANANLRAMIKLFDVAKEKVLDLQAIDFFSFNELQNNSADQAAVARKVQNVVRAFKEGETTASDFVRQIQELYLQINDPGLQTWAEALLEAGRSAKQAEGDLGGAAVAAEKLGNTSQEVAEIIDKTGASIKGLAENASDSIGGLADDAGKFKAALEGIKEEIPALKEELERLGDIDSLNKLYQDAVKLARTMGEVQLATSLYGQAVEAINLKAVGGTGLEKTIALLRKFEGFQETGKWDVNAFRAGFGSDTVTLSDGTIQKITEGMRVSQVDALRDLVRRIGEFQDVIKAQIGSDRFSTFTEEQQAVLSSIAYNYGSLPDRIVEAIKTGTVEDIANAISGLRNDNGGVNAGRREQEAAIFREGGSNPAYEVERVKLAKEYNTELERRLELQAAENANGGKLSREAFIQKAVTDEQNKAKEAGVVLSDAQLAKIREIAAAEWDIKNQKTEQTQEIRDANAALQLANALSAQRATLERQIKEASKSGDLTTAQQLQADLDGVNAKLLEAIEKARAMWEAIGGTAADAALVKLDNLKLKIDAGANSMSIFGLTTTQVQQLVGSFVDGLLNVFDAFAQAIANGENGFKAMGKAFLQFAADFLRQIARMILQQIILNALRSMGLPIPAGHSGGIVGPGGIGVGNMKKRGPAIGAFAMAYHSGGMPGFAPDEVSAVLKKREEVLTESDPRHRNNGGIAKFGTGQSSPQAQTIRNILVLDEKSAADWMGSAAGERVVMNTLRKNSATLKQMVSG